MSQPPLNLILNLTVELDGEEWYPLVKMLLGLIQLTESRMMPVGRYADINPTEVWSVMPSRGYVYPVLPFDRGQRENRYNRLVNPYHLRPPLSVVISLLQLPYCLTV